MATNYAQIDTRSAALDTDFGEEMARKWFGDDVVDALPKYIRGKRAGRPKGFYVWTKVVRGGWVRGYDREDGYVETRVGLTIERGLHELHSCRDGRKQGDHVRSEVDGRAVPCRLGPGETLQSQAERRRSDAAAYHYEGSLDWRQAFREEMALIAQLRRVLRSGVNGEGQPLDEKTVGVLQSMLTEKRAEAAESLTNMHADMAKGHKARGR